MTRVPLSHSLVTVGACSLLLAGCRGFRDQVETVKEEVMRTAVFSLAKERQQLERGVLTGRVLVETDELSFKELRWKDGYSEREEEPFHTVPKIRDDVDAEMTATLILGKSPHGLEIDVQGGRFEVPLAKFREMVAVYDDKVTNVILRFDTFRWKDREIDPEIEPLSIPVSYFHAMKGK
ncbi:MAG: hypothetical protein NXI31_05050 [bacterium]|nr:hypothetical protein [bacterium]